MWRKSRRAASLVLVLVALNYVSEVASKSPQLDVTSVGPKDASNVMIMLHGLGGKGSEFKDLVQMFPDTRLVLPTAPKQPVTLNGGAEMTAWYDLNSLEISTLKHDQSGIDASAKLIADIIREQHSAGAKRIFLAGFSQGGVIALCTAVTHFESIGHMLTGVVALSTYFPVGPAGHGVGMASRTEAVRGKFALPILMCHGKSDKVVLYKYGLESSKFLKASDFPLTFRSYKVSCLPLSCLFQQHHSRLRSTFHSPTPCHHRPEEPRPFAGPEGASGHLQVDGEVGGRARSKRAGRRAVDLRSSARHPH
jgi:phospholipase/carboxylesterase